MTTVVLFEKSSAKREAEKVLPKDFVNIALSGHMLTYKRPDEIKPETLQKIFAGTPPAAGYDGPWVYDNLPFLVRQPPYEIGKDRSNQSHRDAIASIKEKLKAADTVIVATDPGREGSLIAWELLQYCGYKGKVLRMKLGATDAKSIEKAYKECVAGGTPTGDRDYCSYIEALARQMQDYHSGMNGTRCLNIAFPRPREEKDLRHSFGEVIMRVLGLLADLENEIANFKPEIFYKIGMDVDQQGVKGRLTHFPDPILKDAAEAQRIAGVARNWKGPLAVQKKERRSGPPTLFSGAKMFKEAAALFGWKPAKTEAIMQELYDKGYATYPRTEIDFLHANDIADPGNSPQARLGAISATYPELVDLIDGAPFIRNNQNGTYQNTDCEHYAFIPTSKPLGNDVSDDAQKLYSVIAKRFVAHHLPDALEDVTTIRATVADGAQNRLFNASGRIEKSPGWRRVYSKAPDEAVADEKVSKRAKIGEEDEEAVVPPFVDGREAKAFDANLLEGKTQPPRRITFGGLAETCQRLIDWVEDANLKKALFNEANPNQPKGLGTIASAKEFDKKLIEFAYIQEFTGESGTKKKRGKSKDPAIQVTQRGMDLWHFFRKEFADAVDPIARAQTEFELSRIGNSTSRAAADGAYRKFIEDCHEKQRRLVEMFVRTRPRVSSMEYAAIKAAVESGRPITTPYGTNDKVKALGAIWDKERSAWVVPNGVEMKPFVDLGCAPISDMEAHKKSREEYKATATARKSGKGTPINVPWDAEKTNIARAKALGAFWSPDTGSKGSWMVPEGKDTAAFVQAGFAVWDPSSAPAKGGGGGSFGGGNSNRKGTPIDVPWDADGANRQKAKALGAFWSPDTGTRGSWMVPEGKDVSAFEKAGFKTWDPASAKPKSTFNR